MLAGGSESLADFELDYDKAIILDAENLAEEGIGEAYNLLTPTLQEYGLQPAAIEEVADNDEGSYSVRCNGQEYPVYGPELEDSEGQSWGRGTCALFSIINSQLAEINSDYRFYAINGGNDLFGIFLTPDQAEASRKSLDRKSDWPYLPEANHPWYGMFH